MKLTKRLLMARLRPVFSEMGFTEFGGVDKCFCKKVDDYFILCIIPTIHRFYDDAFTVELYLSKITSLCCTYGDIPKECHERPGFLLSEEEKMTRYNSVVSDVWWHCFEDESFDDFTNLIRLVEPRMLERRTSLQERLDNSKDVERLVNEVYSITDIVTQGNCGKGSLDISRNSMGNTPKVWFDAAEYYARNFVPDISEKDIKDYVVHSASRAYRHSILGMPYRAHADAGKGDCLQSKGTKKKRQRYTVGSIVEIPINDGEYYCYAQLLKNNVIAFFDFRTYTPLQDYSVLDNTPELFRTCASTHEISTGVWLKVDKRPIRPEFETVKDMYVYLPFDNRFFIYKLETDEMIPATREQCLGLEKFSIVEHKLIEERFVAHFNHVPALRDKNIEKLFPNDLPYPEELLL